MHYTPCPANHLRYLWRWINHYIIAEVHKVPGSWSNTLHFIAVCRALMLWLIAEWKWLERRKGLRLSNAVNTPDRWSNVCSKSQIVSAKLKRRNRHEEEEKKFICSEDHPHSNWQACKYAVGWVAWSFRRLAMLYTSKQPVLLSQEGPAIQNWTDLSQTKELFIQSICVIVSLLQNSVLKTFPPFIHGSLLAVAVLRVAPFLKTFCSQVKASNPCFGMRIFATISANQPQLGRTVTELSVFSAPIARVLFTEGFSFMEKSRRDWFRLMWLEACTMQRLRAQVNRKH